MRLGVVPRTFLAIVAAVTAMGAAATPAPTDTTGASPSTSPSPTTSPSPSGSPSASPSASPTLPPPPPAEILVNFDPGNIVSDAVFYNTDTMTAADIQTFLEQKNPQCIPGADGTMCLKNFRANTRTKAADDHCSAYQGARRERASTIIYKVSQACGINPQVLLVLLQKEQSLVTDTGANLYMKRYWSATGYKCTDTAPCDPRYKGFFLQVYTAAWRMRDYVLNPANFTYRAGMTADVKYNPKVECGTAPVTIANEATAILYNYTPYQPNAWALAAGTGLGDNCSSYGNRNFYNNFTAWFGSTQG